MSAAFHAPPRSIGLARVVGLTCLLGMGLASCGDDTPPPVGPTTTPTCVGFVEGGLGCPCTSAGQCNAGLMCVSWPRRCVADPSASGGTGGTGGTGGGTGGGSTTGPACELSCAVPPAPPPSGVATTGTGERVLAVRRWLLGTTGRDGNASTQAWRQYGFDLDGLRSSRSDGNHCAPVAGASPAAVKTDGDEGRDNSFGANIITFLDTIAGDSQGETATAIAAGEFTTLLRVGDYAPAPDVVGLDVAWLGAAPGPVPAFDGTDVWPVAAESLDGTPPSLTTPRRRFGTAWVSGGVLVATDVRLTVEVELRMSGVPLRMAVELPTVVVDLRSGPPYAGTLSGVLRAEAFITDLGQALPVLDPSICPGTGTFDSIANQVRAASDIMADGSNGDGSRTCDAISVGLGFEAVDAALGAVAAPVPPPVDPCAP